MAASAVVAKKMNDDDDGDGGSGGDGGGGGGGGGGEWALVTRRPQRVPATATSDSEQRASERSRAHALERRGRRRRPRARRGDAFFCRSLVLFQFGGAFAFFPLQRKWTARRAYALALFDESKVVAGCRRRSNIAEYERAALPIVASAEFLWRRRFASAKRKKKNWRVARAGAQTHVSNRHNNEQI